MRVSENRFFKMSPDPKKERFKGRFVLWGVYLFGGDGQRGKGRTTPLVDQ